jgi:asparagine synthase (glutamine-hydrolysing)
VLAGQGADEPHGGYGRHRAAAMLARLKLVPPALSGPAQVAARAVPRGASARRMAHLLGGQGPAERLMRLVEITDHGQRAQLTGSDGGEAEGERLASAREVLGDVEERSLQEQALYLDTHMFLPDGILVCNDKMSMAASLELRVPFLDVELMRYVERIPPGMRSSARAGKRIHRKAMGRLLPPEIAARPKHGFATPYDGWLRESLGDEVERRYGEGEPLSELIDAGAARRLVEEHRRGRADNKSVLYCLLELSEWHRAFVEAREPVAAQA